MAMATAGLPQMSMSPVQRFGRILDSNSFLMLFHELPFVGMASLGNEQPRLEGRNVAEKQAAQ